MDLPKAIKTTKDGGYIMIGSSNSEDGDAYNDGFSGLDIWVIKINKGGIVQWEKKFGGTSSYDFGNDIIQDNKGNLLLLTTSFSKDGQRKAKNNLGNDDMWLVSADEEGKLLSHRTFGGSLDEFSVKISPSKDKGFFVLGNTKSKDKDIKKFSGKQDIWILKLNKKTKLSWSKCIGFKDNDEAFSFVCTKDGGVVIVGETEEHPESNGLNDLWVIRLNSKGEKLWDYVYGGSLDDRGKDILQLNDGRFIIAGETESSDNIFKENKGAYDCFLMGLSPLGIMEWVKSYGGSSIDYCQKVKFDPNKDEIILLSGSTSKDGDLKNNHGSMDVWLTTHDMQGNLKNSFVFGGKNNEDPQDIIIDKDGNYLILSGTNSNDGDINAKYSYDKNDFWLIKINPDILDLPNTSSNYFGNCLVKTYSGGYMLSGQEIHSNKNADIFIQEYDDTGFEGFKKRLKGNINDIAYGILQSNDGTGSYYVTGTSNSDKGKFDKNKGSYDCFFSKLNGRGEAVFNHNFGGSNDDIGYDLKRYDKNSFVIAGVSRSYDKDVKNAHYGDNDIWILKVNKIGEIEWERSVGGTKEDVAKSIIINKKKQLIIAGYSQSNDNDIKRSYGNMDGLIAILSDTGKLLTVRNFGGNGNDWFNDACLTKDGGYLFVGGTKSITNEEINNSGTQAWIVKANSYGVIDWEKKLGGTGNDEAISVLPLNKHEFIIATNSNSSYNKKTQTRNQYVSVLKVNESGKVLDQKDIKQTNNVYCNDIISLDINTYVVGGYEQDDEKQSSFWSYEFRF